MKLGFYLVINNIRLHCIVFLAEAGARRQRTRTADPNIFPLATPAAA